MTDSNAPQPPRGARFMYVTGAICVLYGIVLVAGAALAGPEALTPLLDLLFASSIEGALPQTTLFSLAIAGALLAGWGASLESLAGTLIRRGRAEAPDVGRALLIGTATWFILDSSASMLTGAPGNVLGNVAFLPLLIPPAWMLMRSGSQSAQWYTTHKAATASPTTRG